MSFRKGDLVWVLGRFPAKVEATEPPDRATWYEVGRGDRYLKNNNSLRWNRCSRHLHAGFSPESSEILLVLPARYLKCNSCKFQFLQELPKYHRLPQDSFPLHSPQPPEFKGNTAWLTCHQPCPLRLDASHRWGPGELREDLGTWWVATRGVAYTTSHLEGWRPSSSG